MKFEMKSEKGESGKEEFEKEIRELQLPCWYESRLKQIKFICGDEFKFGKFQKGEFDCQITIEKDMVKIKAFIDEMTK
jgi:hypothetical protein